MDVRVDPVVVTMDLVIAPGTPVIETEPLDPAEVPSTAVPVTCDGRPFWYTWADVAGRPFRCLVPRRPG